MNHLTLTATLISKDLTRYTPAGLPVIHCQLQYDGEVQEAEHVRQVKMKVEAIAIGLIQEKIAQMDLGVTAVFKGFLAQKNWRNERLVFHINDIN
jgi:primosomal replication protein N